MQAATPPLLTPDPDSAFLSEILPRAELRINEPMSRHTTLRVGGPASIFWPVSDAERLAETLPALWAAKVPYLLVGHGSNLLVGDGGFPGVVIQNRCKKTRIGTITYSECGVSFGSLFLQTAKAGLSGLEWAIGIPGTVGGALVSNAGAYRGNIGPLVRRVRVFHEGTVRDEGPEWLEFAYRDSRLRREIPPRSVVLDVHLELSPGHEPDRLIERAKQYQAERRIKQPLEPSAGSFFKNVHNRELAESLPDLAPALREAGVVPTGFLSMKAGCRGWRVGGAGISEIHGNFLVNLGGATAWDFRHLADRVKARIFDLWGVTLEEEVLSVGVWPQPQARNAEPAGGDGV